MALEMVLSIIVWKTLTISPYQRGISLPLAHLCKFGPFSFTVWTRLLWNFTIRTLERLEHRREAVSVHGSWLHQLRLYPLCLVDIRWRAGLTLDEKRRKSHLQMYSASLYGVIGMRAGVTTSSPTIIERAGGFIRTRVCMTQVTTIVDGDDKHYT